MKLRNRSVLPFVPGLLTLALLGWVASPSAIAQQFDDPLFAPLNNGTQSISREEADRLMRFGGQAERQRLYAKAIGYWRQAAEIYHHLGDLQALGLAYDYIGVSYTQLGHFDDAELYLRRRLAIARYRDDFRGQAYGLNNLGMVLIQNTHYTGAEAAFLEALEISRSIGSQETEGLSLSNLGRVAAAIGDYPKAIKLYKEALIFRRRFGDSAGEANTRNNLGDAYYAVQDYREARASYGYARQLAREIRDIPTQFRSSRGIVNSYLAMGETAAALVELRRWLALSRANSDSREALAALRLGGQVLFNQGDRAEAKVFFEEALAIALRLEDRLEEAFLRSELAQTIYQFPAP